MPPMDLEMPDPEDLGGNVTKPFKVHCNRHSLQKLRADIE